MWSLFRCSQTAPSHTNCSPRRNLEEDWSRKYMSKSQTPFSRRGATNTWRERETRTPCTWATKREKRRGWTPGGRRPWSKTSGVTDAPTARDDRKVSRQPMVEHREACVEREDREEKQWRERQTNRVFSVIVSTVKDSHDISTKLEDPKCYKL